MAKKGKYLKIALDRLASAAICKKQQKNVACRRTLRNTWGLKQVKITGFMLWL